ncbi:MAG: YoaK family protein [Gaiellaceae bacterium]
MTVWSDAVETLGPRRGSPDGPLPPLLLLLTVVTGLVDAAGFLNLGHVFVANMTGNVVFLGFALAGAKGLSATASLVALASFVAGSVAGGRLGVRFAERRLHLLSAALAVQLAVVAVAALVAALEGDPVDRTVRFVLIALLALAMGIQNATVRRLAVPELTTTVLTMTLTGIGADSTVGGGTGSKLGRRSLAVAAMLLGAFVGAVLALHVDTAAALAAAAGVLAVTAFAAHRLTRVSPV